jgi:hypothetical protein
MHDASELIRAIAALAWPVFAIVAVFVFRHQLARVLSTAGPLRRARVGPLEAEWEAQLAEAEVEIEAAGLPTPAAFPSDLAEDLAAVAAASPSAAVMEAYVRVEAELRQMLLETGMDLGELRAGAAGLARIAATNGRIPPETVRAVEGLGVLRNLAAHGRAGDLTPEQAHDYLVLADSVLYAIRNPPGRSG